MDFGLSSEIACNLLMSLTDASDNNRRFSNLFVTTTPDPLSGVVMTISLLRYSCSIAPKSVLEGFGPLRWM